MDRYKMLRKLNKSEEGYTFVELLLSILLLAFITVAFMNVFLVATKSNVEAHLAVDAGYVAQDCMEEVYGYSQEMKLPELITKMGNALYSHSHVGASHEFTKQIEKYHVLITITPAAHSAVKEELTNVSVRVYEDSGHTKLVASAQNIIYIAIPTPTPTPGP